MLWLIPEVQSVSSPKCWQTEYYELHHLQNGSLQNKIFSNEPIKVLGQFATMVTYNDWTCNDAHLTVLEGGHKIIIGRDLFNSLGLAVFQQQAEIVKCVNNINNSTCKIKDTIAAKFPYLVSRIGLSKTHVAKSKFHQKFTAKDQKGRSKAPEIKLQPRVTADLDRLQTKGQIEKLSICSDEHFILSLQ